MINLGIKTTAVAPIAAIAGPADHPSLEQRGVGGAGAELCAAVALARGIRASTALIHSVNEARQARSACARALWHCPEAAP